MYKNEDELGPNCEIIDEKDDIRAQRFDRRTQKQSGQATVFDLHVYVIVYWNLFCFYSHKTMQIWRRKRVKA
jgi:hypothetical protein